MRVLVTGGAGYIGGAIARLLLDRGIDVTILDDLSTGHRNSLPDSITFYEGSLLNPATLSSSLKEVDAVVHCAGKSLVAESVSDPDKYHLNNVEGTKRLVVAMTEKGVDRIVFSSSAAVYASAPEALTEDSFESPSNPYGATKLEVDRLLLSSGFKGASFRYFNVGGAVEQHGRWHGEAHHPETHLIPNVLTATKENPLSVFGSDWPTADGTCVRDYIHVSDLAQAHVAALTHDRFDICNLGTGIGSSVIDVINAASDVLERQVPYVVRERREGDPPVLVASFKKAERLFGWRPTKSLKQMVKDAESFRAQPW